MTNLLMFQQASLNFVHTLQSFSIWKRKCFFHKQSVNIFNIGIKRSGKMKKFQPEAFRLFQKSEFLGSTYGFCKKTLYLLYKWNR